MEKHLTALNPINNSTWSTWQPLLVTEPSLAGPASGRNSNAIIKWLIQPREARWRAGWPLQIKSMVGLVLLQSPSFGQRTMMGGALMFYESCKFALPLLSFGLVAGAWSRLEPRHFIPGVG